MSRRAPKLCAHVGPEGPCYEPVPNGAKHCPAHKQPAWRSAGGPTTASTVAGHRPGWPRLRAEVLERDGHTCQMRLPGCLVHASEVDHVVPVADGGTDDKSNLRAACHPCHATTTARHARATQLGRVPKAFDPLRAELRGDT